MGFMIISKFKIMYRVLCGNVKFAFFKEVFRNSSDVFDLILTMPIENGKVFPIGKFIESLH